MQANTILSITGFAQKNILALSIAAWLSGFSGTTSAAAFQLNYQSTEAIGLANAGRATRPTMLR